MPSETVRYTGRSRYGRFRDGSKAMVRKGIAHLISTDNDTKHCLIEMEVSSGYVRLWVPEADIERRDLPAIHGNWTTF